MLLNYKDKSWTNPWWNTFFFLSKRKDASCFDRPGSSEMCWLVFKKFYDFCYFYCESVRDSSALVSTVWLLNNPLTVDYVDLRSLSLGLSSIRMEAELFTDGASSSWFNQVSTQWARLSVSFFWHGSPYSPHPSWLWDPWIAIRSILEESLPFSILDRSV